MLSWVCGSLQYWHISSYKNCLSAVFFIFSFFSFAAHRSMATSASVISKHGNFSTPYKGISCSGLSSTRSRFTIPWISSVWKYPVFLVMCTGIPFWVRILLKSSSHPVVARNNSTISEYFAGRCSPVWSSVTGKCPTSSWILSATMTASFSFSVIGCDSSSESVAIRSSVAYCPASCGST